MRQRFFLSVLPLIFIVACSIEDPGSDPPEPKQEEPVPKEEEDTQPPSVPQDLVISEVAFESLTLTWKASSDNDKVAKYVVYLNSSQAAEVSTTTSTLSGLSPGTSYSLTVAAIDASGNSSEPSPPLEAATTEDTEAPSVPQALTISGTTETSVSFSWEASSDNAGILEYDIFLNGELLATTANTSFNVENLQKGTAYIITVSARDIYGNSSEQSQPLEISTESSEETPSENSSGLLYFSEYIEGSSYNKALEIANNSGADINLASYSIKKISNENTEWSDERPLEGTLAHGEVFVLAHSKSIPEILQQADLQMGGGIMDFNGNDTVGLFKDGELVDIIGKTGGEDFAKDVTLRRKTPPTTPNMDFNPNDWEVLETDTVDGLGIL